MAKKGNLNLTLLKIVGSRPIVFNPFFAKLGGSIQNAIFLAQILYWQSVVGDDWFYKTSAEMEEETTLTRRQQDTAIEKWVGLGVLQYEVRGVPARRHFKVETKYLIAAVNSSGLNTKKISIKEKGRTFTPSFDG